MFNQEEKRWQMLRDALENELHGEGPRVVRSQRTLFGIPSQMETVIKSVAEEDEERCQKLIEDSAAELTEDQQDEIAEPSGT